MCEDRSVIVASVPVPVAGFSAVLSLLTLNISTPIGERPTSVWGEIEE